MEKKRILCVPWSFVHNYYPKNKSDLITNEVRKSLNNACISNILDHVKLLFNNHSIQG